MSLNSEKPFLQKRLDREHFTGLPLTLFALVFIIFLGTFIGITESIIHSLFIVKIDVSIAQFLSHLQTPFLQKGAYALSYIADQVTVIILGVVIIVYLIFKKEFAYLYGLLLSVLGAVTTEYIVKIIINRPRPIADVGYYIEAARSFPSGHATIALAFFGAITYYLLRHTKSRNIAGLTIFLGWLLIGLIGLSRMYLGEHYLSDVLGGYLIGGLWLLAGITFREHHFYTTSHLLKDHKD